MCKVCGSTEKLMPTGEVYREGTLIYKRFICPICDNEEFEVGYIHKKQKKNKPNRLLSLISASITASSVFVGTFYIFSHLEKFTTIFIK